MSVTVRHLNADSSFLLTLSPEENPKPSDLRAANGAISILIDPWIVGSSITTAPWFAITHRVQPSAIRHLSELEDEPDIVLCSQNKADHTNKDTLLQLRPEAKTIIVAEPGAAKTIKSWNHFDPNRIHAMSKYDKKVKFGNLFRFHIPALSSEGHEGEINIAFIPAKNYMTGLHNAFGITYQPPTRSKSWARVSTMDLPMTKVLSAPATFNVGSSATSLPLSFPSLEMPFTDGKLLMTPLTTTRSYSATQDVRPHLSHSTNTESSENSQFGTADVASATSERFPSEKAPRMNRTDSDGSNGQSGGINFVYKLPTPPESPPGSAVVNSPTSRGLTYQYSKTSLSSNDTETSPSINSLSKSPTIYPARAKALSVLYMPHGLDLVELEPYIKNHLIRLPGALPLTCLLHSFDFAQNPWYLGGNIMRGAAGGISIATALMARCWISAHDEEKDDRGIAVKQIKLQRTAAEEIKRLLVPGQPEKKNGWQCDVRSLDAGEAITLTNNRYNNDKSSNSNRDTALRDVDAFISAKNFASPPAGVAVSVT